MEIVSHAGFYVAEGPLVRQNCENSPSSHHLALDIAFHLGGFHGLAFVVLLFAATDAQHHFGQSSLEVHFERNERESFFLSPVGESFDLAAVHQQFSWPAGGVIESVGLEVLGNIAAQQPHFVVLHLGVGFFQRHVAGAQTLHLAAHQNNAALQRVENQVVMAGFAVLRNDLFIGIGRGRPLFLRGLFARNAP